MNCCLCAKQEVQEKNLHHFQLISFTNTNVSVKLKLSGKDAKCPLKEEFSNLLGRNGRKKAQWHLSRTCLKHFLLGVRRVFSTFPV